MPPKREILNRQQHAGLRYTPGKRFDFASGMMSVPMVSAEAGPVAREYVFAFDREQPKIHVLLGAVEGFNGHVTGQGQWIGRYIPAHIRAYPFSPALVSGQDATSKENLQLTILIDPQAAQLNDPEGELLIDENGKPTEFLSGVQNAMANLHSETVRTNEHVAQLDQLQLLVERPIEIKRLNISLAGYRVIDSERLKQLNGDELAALRDSGALPVVYAQLLSLSNAKDSPIIRAPEVNPPVVEDKQAQDFFTDEDFNLDFSKFRN